MRVFSCIQMNETFLGECFSIVIHTGDSQLLSLRQYREREGVNGLVDSKQTRESIYTMLNSIQVKKT